MRRVFAALLCAFASTLALAQSWPDKPIHMLVAFPPGGPTDIMARLVGTQLSASLGQPVVVENRVGASGNLATQEVAKSAPDGYTMLIHSSAYAVNPTLFSNAGYDPAKYELMWTLNQAITDAGLPDPVELTPRRGDILFYHYLCAHAVSRRFFE